MATDLPAAIRACGCTQPLGHLHPVGHHRLARRPARRPLKNHPVFRSQTQQPDNDRIGAKPPSCRASVSSNPRLRECELRLRLRSTPVKRYFF